MKKIILIFLYFLFLIKCSNYITRDGKAIMIYENLGFLIQSDLIQDKIKQESLNGYSMFYFREKVNGIYSLKIEITAKIKKHDEITMIKSDPLKKIPKEFYISTKDALKKKVNINNISQYGFTHVSFHQPSSYEVAIEGDWKKGHKWILSGGRVIFQYFFIYKRAIIRLWVDADFGLKVKEISEIKKKYSTHKDQFYQFIKRFTLVKDLGEEK